MQAPAQAATGASAADITPASGEESDRATELAPGLAPERTIPQNADMIAAALRDAQSGRDSAQERAAGLAMRIR